MSDQQIVRTELKRCDLFSSLVASTAAEPRMWATH